MNYYNEWDKHAAAWLKALIADGLIPKGEVDTRSITEVQPSDLAGFTECHFFAGIGGWPLALAMAGFPDSRPCWTGSAPCQPFSQANVGHGEKKGRGDSRHLAPAFVSLIEVCRPPVVFGEQVAAAIGEGWLDELFNELERQNYACGAVVMQASTFGADHERQRLYWGAHAGSTGREGCEPVKRLPFSAPAAQPITGDNFTDARRAMAGDIGDLLLCDGVSVTMERHALKGYGNAIVPQVAAEFIRAFMETACRPDVSG